MFVKRQHASHDFELNLTAIIDCFVTLICFLLLSATYVNLVGLDAKVPIAVASASVSNDKEPKFKLELVINSVNAMELQVSGAGSLSGKKKFAGKDLTGLHNELVRIKKAYPKEFSIHFTSNIDMAYEELIKYMETTRNLDDKDGLITTVDERNGKPLKVDLLFPDFVLANLGAK